jgi:hypothetical protein
MFKIHAYLQTTVKVDDPIRIFLIAKTISDIMKQDATLADAKTGEIGMGVGPIGTVSDLAFLRFIETNNLPHADEDRVVKVQGSAKTLAGAPYDYVLYALILPVQTPKPAAAPDAEKPTAPAAKEEIPPPAPPAPAAKEEPPPAAPPAPIAKEEAPPPAPPAECPSCGRTPGRFEMRNLKYTCPHCQAGIEYSERDLPRGSGANLLCASCRQSLKISARMWCGECRQGLLSNGRILQMLAEENGVELSLLTRESRTPNLEDMERAARMLLGPDYAGSKPTPPKPPPQKPPAPVPPPPPPPAVVTKTPKAGKSSNPKSEYLKGRLNRPIVLFAILIGMGTICLLGFILLGGAAGLPQAGPAATPTSRAEPPRPVATLAATKQSAESESNPTGIPVVLGVTLREGQGAEGLVIYQDVLLQDSEGDIYYLDIQLVSSTKPDVEVVPGLVDIPWADQMLGAIWTGTWTCGGGTYTVTLSITPRDTQGHTGLPYEYTMKCR